jgi:putative tricarboxylic transport membrane protein
MSTRWVELATALLLLAVGALVVGDSLRVGAGWADDGPQSGYFPFWIGVVLCGAALFVAAQQLRRWAHTSEVFADRTQLALVWSVLWPMVVHVALIRFVGIYVASALLIAWFMLRHGEHRKAMVAAVAVGVPAVFFVVFESWFVVPLPKGPLEALFGY